jgi:hypothetical protein
MMPRMRRGLSVLPEVGMASESWVCSGGGPAK